MQHVKDFRWQGKGLGAAPQPRVYRAQAEAIKTPLGSSHRRAPLLPAGAYPLERMAPIRHTLALMRCGGQRAHPGNAYAGMADRLVWRHAATPGWVAKVQTEP